VSATTRPSESRTAAPRSRRKYVIGFVALLLFAAFAVVVASKSDPSKVASLADVDNLPVGPKVPGLSAAKGWINSPPLTSADLRGKVVLYDFWTYSCVNCVRTIPHIRSWYDRYQKDGLVVVGVHSPEFDFEKNHDNVRAAVARLHVDYPVALDDDMAIWSEFSNMYWPADYIADRQGRLRDMSIGEGSDTHTEDVIRKLLGIVAGAPRATLGATGKLGKPPTASEDITPETYLGLQRGIAGAQPGVTRYPDGGSLTRDTPRLVGSWFGDTEDVSSVEPGAAIAIEYRASEVNLVMASAAPDSGPIDVRVELDGKPLPPAYRTSQTMVDADGNTNVEVQASDLYRLVLGPSIGAHTLRLTAEAPNLEAFAFTFSA
jgi:thiol-disulfide isomerase/thioredoxin